MKSPKREAINYTQFASEAQTYLAEVRSGMSEDVALEITMRDYPYITEDDLRTWGRDPEFRDHLAHARRVGREDREYLEAKAARHQDVFATPPRPGQVDLAAQTFDPRTEKQPGALSRFLRKLGVEIEWQSTGRNEPRPSGQLFIPVGELTPAQAQAIGRRRDEEAQRVRAEQAAAEQPWGGPQTWGKGEAIAPDGAQWKRAPSQHGGGLFSHTPNPDSVPG